MCGITGVCLIARSKPSNVALGEILTKSLKLLEYRGYDSVGISIIDNSKNLVVRKAKGKIDEVSKKLSFHALDGLVGIGHTRWATHGPPNDVNAHPHIDCAGRIAVVHNGIIRNYLDLKSMLQKRSHVFRSDTDTEVIAHLIEEFYKGNAKKGFYDAFKKAVTMLRGSYAIAVITTHEPNKIFFAKRESPLVLGFSKLGNLVASDIPALLDYTNTIMPLNDGEIGWISPSEVHVESIDAGEPVDVKKRAIAVSWKPEMAKKGGYPHYMIKEIYEQPVALKNTYEGLLSDDSAVKAAEILSAAKRIFITAAGTSYHAGLVTKYFLELLARTPIYTFVSSEYKHASLLAESGDVLIALSQSGETIDTLKAVRAFRARGAKTIAITNVLGSAIERESDLTVLTRAGPEIGVAATKTFTVQMLTGIYIAAYTALNRGKVDLSELKHIVMELGKAGKLVGESIVSSEEEIKRESEIISSARSVYFLGRGIGHFLALEAALKLKEIAYIHAESYPAGESKHGPIALVEKGFPVIFIVTSDSIEEIGSNIAEMKARGALIIAFVAGRLEKVDSSLLVTELPSTSKILEPFALTPPFQLLSYYTAVRLGRDPDKPRNLAKTVTVE